VRSKDWARGLGLNAGLVLVALAVIAWHVPQGRGRLGLDVTFLAGPTGELGVTPAGPLLRATGLQAGAPGPVATNTVRHQTPRTLMIRLRARPSSGALDEVLWTRVARDGRPLLDAPLGRLRTGAPLFRLAAGRRAELQLGVRLPAASVGYGGAILDVPLELTSRPVGRAAK